MAVVGDALAAVSHVEINAVKGSGRDPHHPFARPGNGVRADVNDYGVGKAVGNQIGAAHMIFLYYWLFLGFGVVAV